MGGEIAAAEAESLGLINHVFEERAVESQAEVFAQRISKLSPSALSLSKNLLYKMDSLSFIEALESGVDVNVIARMSEDCTKGIARFLKKE